MPQGVLQILPRDLGERTAIFSWSLDGRRLAAAGSKGVVQILARSGQVVDSIVVADAARTAVVFVATVAKLEWNCNSQLLVITFTNQPYACLYDAEQRSLSRIEIGLKDHLVTWAGWSQKLNILALTTSRGSLLLINPDLPGAALPMEKAEASITCGAWNTQTLLALASQNNKVTVVYAHTGETLKVLDFKGPPSSLLWADSAGEEEAAGDPVLEHTLAVNVAGQTLLICRVEGHAAVGLGGHHQPVELVFVPTYGSITSHLWFGLGNLLVGFSSGRVLVLGTEPGSIDRELFSRQLFQAPVAHMCFCPYAARAVLAGGSRVELLELANEVRVDEAAASDFGPHCVSQLGWTGDGQLFTVATEAGSVTSMLAQLPPLYCSSNTRIAYLTALREVAIADIMDPRYRCSFDADGEPSLLAVADHGLAMAWGNKVWFMQLQDGVEGPSMQLACSQEYPSTITAVATSGLHGAAICAGSMHLSALSNEGDHSSQEVMLEGLPSNISCMAMTAGRLVCGSDRGRLTIFDPTDGHLVRDARHEAAVALTHVMPSPDCSRVLYEDSAQNVFMWDERGCMIPIPDITGPLETAVWALDMPGIFALSDVLQLHLYAYLPNTLTGPEMRVIGTQACPSGSPPMALAGGRLYNLSDQGVLDAAMLEAFAPLQDGGGHEAAFKALLPMNCLDLATEAAEQLDTPDIWRELAEAAVHVKDVGLAARCYAAAGDRAAEQALLPLCSEADAELVTGHLLLLLDQNLDAAQEHFLRSSRPQEALNMRCQAEHWDKALELAVALDPAQVGQLSCLQAQVLEGRGDFTGAEKLYSGALQSHMGQVAPDVALTAQRGLARMRVRQGNVKGGVDAALALGDPGCCRECAELLEQGNHLQAAARLYEAAGDHQTATALYIRAQRFEDASRLISDTGLQDHKVGLAKAREEAGDWPGALEDYQAAGDAAAIVRILLGPMQRPEEACEIARHSGNQAALQQAAAYLLQTGNHEAGIDFLLLAGARDEALQAALKHGLLGTFLDHLGAGMQPEDMAMVARGLEAQGEFGQAGELWAQAGEPGQAARCFLKAGGPHVEQALHIAESSPELHMLITPALVEYLDSHARFIGQHHALPGLPDPSSLLRARVLAGRCQEASEEALKGALACQAEGDYKGGHDLLVALWRGLTRAEQPLPAAAMKALGLLHSYLLLRPLTALGEHETAARLLIRISASLDAFPCHAAAILTSTVVECHRAGLAGAAYTHATRLMQPQLKAALNPAYKRKIEGLVRRRERGEDPDEEVVACPFCEVEGSEWELECSSCSKQVPFCIASGRRLAMRDWSQCPSCSLPARSTSLATYAAAGQPCPICGHHIATLDTGSITDPHAALSALTGFQSSSRRGKVKAAAANYSQMHLQILAS